MCVLAYETYYKMLGICLKCFTFFEIGIQTRMAKRTKSAILSMNADMGYRQKLFCQLNSQLISIERPWLELSFHVAVCERLYISHHVSW